MCELFCQNQGVLLLGQNMGVTSNITTTYKSKHTKYFGINLLLTWEQLLHAPTVQIWAQNSTILTPNNLAIFCQAHMTNWSLATQSLSRINWNAHVSTFRKWVCPMRKSFLSNKGGQLRFFLQFFTKKNKKEEFQSCLPHSYFQFELQHDVILSNSNWSKRLLVCQL